MHYEVWDVESGNCSGSFDDEAAALGWVQALLDRFGVGYADKVVLGGENQSSEDVESWSGDALRARLNTPRARKATAAD